MALSESGVHPPDLKTVLDKCDYFTDVQVWPIKTVLDPQSWLRNFTENQREYAIHLLNGFIYYNEAMTEQLFEAAFHGLSLQLGLANLSIVDARRRWDQFRDTMLVTHVTGEEPNDTDSGYAFSRMARQRLGIDQNRIISQRQIAQRLKNSDPPPVVLVDDFVGSGNQCVTTWNRVVKLEDGSDISFRELSNNPDIRFYYCPLICTEQGCDRITRECDALTLSPAHVIDEKYSALPQNSIIWPEHLRAGAQRFLETASARAGIPFTDWKGYADLGLALAIHKNVPDATLPIFHWEKNGWCPLIRRT